MPAILTHDFFGQDAYGTVLQSIRMSEPDERDVFLLGNQGPDPLFYLKLMPPLKEFEELGGSMHCMPPSHLFASMRSAVDALPTPAQGVGRAYLAGFTCHYLLDRAVHPLVYWWERGICQAGVDGLDLSDHDMVHAEIERDLDEMVLFAKTNQTIRTYRPYQMVLRGSDEMLGIVGDLYLESVMGPLVANEPTAARVFPLAVRCFRFTQRMFWSPSNGKARMLQQLEKPALHVRYSRVKAMSHRVRPEATSDFDNSDHRPWKAPATGVVSTASFWDLYNGALDQVGAAVSAVLADGFDEQAAHVLTQGLNFSGEPVE